MPVSLSLAPLVRLPSDAPYAAHFLACFLGHGRVPAEFGWEEAPEPVARLALACATCPDWPMHLLGEEWVFALDHKTPRADGHFDLMTQVAKYAARYVVSLEGDCTVSLVYDDDDHTREVGPFETFCRRLLGDWFFQLEPDFDPEAPEFPILDHQVDALFSFLRMVTERRRTEAARVTEAVAALERRIADGERLGGYSEALDRQLRQARQEQSLLQSRPPWPTYALTVRDEDE